MGTACDKIHKCGHFCGGIRGEKKCLPCLKPECVEIHKKTLEVDEDSFCNICYITGLGSSPSV